MFPRHRMPYEGTRGVHLNFNFWMQKMDIQAMLPSDVQKMCNSLLDDLPPRQGVTTNDSSITESLVMVILNGLDSENISDLCKTEEVPFLASSSSIPVIAVRKFQSSKTNGDGRLLTNPNLWFYNDVKSLESELLHTMVPPVLHQKCISILQNVRSESLLWMKSHSLIFSLNTITKSENVNDHKWLVCRPNSLSIEECAVLREPILNKMNNMLSMKDILHRSSTGNAFTLSYAYGKFLVVNVPSDSEDYTYGSSISKGFYFVDARKRENGEELIYSIVLAWESGAVDVLQPVEDEELGESSDNSPVSTKLFRSVDLSKLNSQSDTIEDDNVDEVVEMKLSHVFPLYHNAFGVASDETEEDLVPELPAAADASMVVESVKPTLESVLSDIHIRFTSLALHDVSKLILGIDTLEILGYLCEDLAVIPEFVSSRDPTWPLSVDALSSIYLDESSKKTLPDTLKSSNTSGDSSGHHIRFDSVPKKDLEEGEEEEGEIVEEQIKSDQTAEETITSSTEVSVKKVSLADRINQQAIHWIAKEYTSLDSYEESTSGSKKRKRHNDEDESAPSLSTILPLDIAAMDCEMCETVDGLELTRITILHPVHGVVLDTLVKPAKAIVNYHTEFSGVSEVHLDQIDISLQDIQTLLRVLISRETILVGHSFDNDLRAIRLFHDRIIDTSALFVHPSGFPYKYALKKLTKEILKWDIQDGAEGHDSAQDAAATLLLAVVKAEEEGRNVIGQNAEFSLSSSNSNVSESLRSSHFHQRFVSRNTFSGAAAMYSDVFAPLPRYSWPQHLDVTHTASETASIGNLSVICHPSVPQAQRWEREGLGYPIESDPLQAFYDCYSNDSSSKSFEMIKTNSWRDAFAAANETVQSMSSSSFSSESSSSLSLSEKKRKNIVWVSVDVGTPASTSSSSSSSSSTSAAATTLLNKSNDHSHTAGGDGQPLKKRPRQENETDTAACAGTIADEMNLSCSAAGPSSSRLSTASQIDQSLEQLYDNMPRNSKLLIFTQRNLLPLRKLIAKKLRKRWDSQSASKKRVRVAMPKVKSTACGEWDNQVDEAKLLEEANAAARCCLFIREK